MFLGQICKDAIIMTIISRTVIGASLLISILSVLSQVAVAQNRVQAITLRSVEGNDNVQINITPAENTFVWHANEQHYSGGNIQKKNDQAIAKSMLSGKQGVFGKKEVEEHVAPGLEKIFSVLTPDHGEQHNLNIKLKFSGQEFCHIKCFRVSSDKKSFHCSEIKTEGSNGYHCNLLLNYKEIPISNVDKILLLNRESKKNYTITSPIIVAYKMHINYNNANFSSASNSHCSAEPPQYSPSRPSAPPPYKDNFGS